MEKPIINNDEVNIGIPSDASMAVKSRIIPGNLKHHPRKNLVYSDKKRVNVNDEVPKPEQTEI